VINYHLPFKDSVHQYLKCILALYTVGLLLLLFVLYIRIFFGQNCVESTVKIKQQAIFFT